MPTPDELVASAIAYFFDTALPQASGKQFADLPSPSVHLGAYTAWDNTAVTSSAGPALTPAYALRVSAPLPVQNNKPSPAGVTAPTSGPARHLLWVREVADAAVDDAAEIQRVMADLDTFVALFGSADAGSAAGAPAPGTPPGPSSATTAVAAARSAEWAAAIVAARGSLGVNLSTLTAVPAGLESVAPDLAALKEVLQHFFSYAPDGSYYPRWAGAGRDAANPDHLTALYKQNNVLERQLERDQVYLYGYVPESVLSGRGDLGSGTFREFVVRFDPTGAPSDPFRLATVHTVRTRSQSAPFCDFVFFAAGAGQGLPVPRTSVAKMSAGLVTLVADLATAAAAGGQQVNGTVFGAGDDGVLRANMIAMVHGEPSWPPGVICTDTGDVRVLQTPADQIAAIAALPEVTNLAVFAANDLHNDQARAMADWAGLDAKLPAGQKSGQGVLVGVIDSGIDGSHPAFAGRLHAVWDQGRPNAVPAGNPPSLNHPAGDPLHAAYANFNFGVELTGAATATSVDIDYLNLPGAVPVPPAHGHGTHVSAIAAGAEVRDVAGNVLVAAGKAPLARIAVVRTIQAGARDGDDVLGARWIFQKATELGVPCVINMSYGHHNHGHDGTDDNATAFLTACRDASKNYLPGRILVASAGNDRKVNMHVRRQVPAHSGMSRTAAIINLPPSFQQGLDIWVRDPTGTKPAAFPMSVYLFRMTARRNTFHDVSRRITLGNNAVGTTPAGLFVNHNTKIQIATFVSHPLNGDHRFRVLFSTTSAPTSPAPVAMITNQWGVVLVNDSDQPVDVHMWLTGGGATFADATGDDDHAYLIGQPAASAATISVASAVSRLVFTTSAGQPGPPPGNEQSQVRELSTFSSPGPLRPSSIPPSTYETVTHEINGVDVAAPGGFTQSAMSSQVPALPNAAWVINNLARIMTGTSQAAPVITGLVANLLAVEPTLTMPQVLARLKAASTIPTTSDFQPPPGGGPKPLSVDWGYGLIDAAALRP